MTDNKIDRVSAARSATEGRGETFYPGPSRTQLAAYPPKERWDDWVELDSRAWPQRVERHYMLVPTTCFNCESACGLLAYVDRETLQVKKFEGNPEHPGSRGRNCAKGPATLNQVTDPDRILFPLKRAGKRGENRWQRVSWDEALDDIAPRIRKAIAEKRNNEVMYHVGRPGEDGYTERVLAAWDVDGHNSHTNICSSGGRAGYQWWMGYDRPSPDHANADVILLISSHLESGHYFNPHAQRVMEGKKNGAKLIVLDVRLSNTATHADHWLAPWPGTEPAILLAIANHLVQNRLYDREFVRRWWNWQEFMEEERKNEPATFEAFERTLERLYAEYTFAFAERESGVPAAVIEEVAGIVASAGTRLSTHTWRSAAAGNLGGWQVSRTLFLLNALLGAVGVPGGTFPNAWNKFVPKPIYSPPHPHQWNELTWPQEFPLAMNEMSFLLPHLLKDGRGKLEVYFSRVYNPVWTNPDGFSWIEAITDESKIGLHVALTPTWSESAAFADYVLPVGVGSERHDIHSYETHDAQWLGFRQPVLREAKARMGQPVADTREVNPGEVWEENELWIELSWRIDPDGAMGIRKYFESKKEPGKKLTVDEYYAFIFESSLPGLPEKAKAEDLTPLEYMRRYGAFEISRKVGAQHESAVPEAELQDVRVSPRGRAYTRAEKPPSPNVVPVPSPDPDPEGRRPVGVELDGDGPARLPDPERPARVLLLDPEALGLARARPARLHPEPRPPVEPRAGRDAAHPDLPPAGPDPHPEREREVARRDRAHEPAVAAPEGRGEAGGRDRRPRAGRDAHRPLRGEGLGDRGHPAGRRRLQPPHGPVEDRRGRAAPDDGDGEPEARGHLVDAPAREKRRALRLRGRRHLAHLVDGRRRSPEPHVPRAARPHLRHALLAPGGAGEEGRPRRPLRRRLGGHREGPQGLRGVDVAHPARDPALARRHAAALLAAAAAQAGTGGLPAAGMDEARRCLTPPPAG